MGQSTNRPASQAHSGALSRLVAAATVSTSFRKLLLSNPAAALAAGYRGELFGLTSEECSRVLQIRAASLSEFASFLVNPAPESVFVRSSARVEMAHALPTANEMALTRARRRHPMALGSEETIDASHPSSYS